jgi:type IV pilus assembly protein PilP
MRKKNQQVIWAVLLCMFSFRSFCENDLTRYIEHVKARSVKPIEALPEFLPHPSFKYPDTPERRSPFEVIIVETIGLKKTEGVHPSLESFSLDELNFVGTLRQENVTWGLIRQPAGLILHVSVGDYIGQNRARITSITNKKIKLLETRMVDGEWQQRKRSLIVTSI